MFGVIPLIIVILLLIKRDIDNSRKNQNQMDKLAKRIMPSFGPKRNISLRNDAKPQWLTGRRLIYGVILALVALNIFLGSIYLADPNFFKRNKPFEKTPPIHEKSSKAGIVDDYRVNLGRLNKPLNTDWKIRCAPLQLLSGRLAGKD